MRDEEQTNDLDIIGRIGNPEGVDIGKELMSRTNKIMVDSPSIQSLHHSRMVVP